MADPFGSDDNDFDTHKLCSDAYENAVAYLATHLPEAIEGETLAKNPLEKRLKVDNDMSPPTA